MRAITRIGLPPPRLPAPPTREGAVALLRRAHNWAQRIGAHNVAMALGVGLDALIRLTAEEATVAELRLRLGGQWGEETVRREVTPEMLARLGGGR